MLRTSAEPSWQIRMSLNQLPSLNLERTWYRQSKDSNGDTMNWGAVEGGWDKRAYLNHKMYIGQSSPQVLPNQSL